MSLMLSFATMYEVEKKNKNVNDGIMKQSQDKHHREYELNYYSNENYMSNLKNDRKK